MIVTFLAALTLAQSSPPAPTAVLKAHCLSCHNASSTAGGVRLDRPLDAALARKVVTAVGYTGAVKMPPAGKLPATERGALERWASAVKPAGPHWAFQPLKLPSVPKIAGAANPIDAFVRARLAKEGLRPSAPADKRTLLRRVTFDLTGLPPTPQETAAFLADKRPDAYAKAVDRLLASPAYGERWGRHWLDVVHYGDTHGYDKDKRRDNAWPYRDWVVRALNSDLPFTQFLTMQLAGDLIAPGSPDGVIATGFVVAGPWDFVGQVELAEGTVEKEKTRVLDRDDLVVNAMATFNSVTVHCARCHDHKFDPIPQKDYYRLQAVFAGVERGDRTIGEGESESATSSGSPSNGYHSAIEPSADTEKWVQLDLGRAVPLDRLRLIPARPTDFADTPGFGFPPRFQVAVADEPSFATATIVADHRDEDLANPGTRNYNVELAGQKARYVRITATRLWKRTDDYVFALAEVQVFSGGKNIARGAKVSAKDSIEQGRWSTRFLTDGFDSRGSFGRQSYAVVSRTPRPIAVLARGEVEQPQERVRPGALSCLPGLSPDLPVPENAGEGMRRKALAEWLASPRNPLTWRSVVNRVWQYHFGVGIVATPNDFGKNGALPTHPELLDWLALWFRDNGQSLKALHRLIVTSQTYCQSSAPNPLALKKDADNRLLWRQNRRRLDAEEVRDSVLLVSGTLDRTMGGPGYALFRFKDDHSPIYDHTALEPVLDPKTWRRTLYRFTVRSVPNPLLESLDCADPNVSTPVRNTTLTALQSLALLNDPFLLAQAEQCAARVRRTATTPEAQVTTAFSLAFSRAPTPKEAALAAAYVRRHGLENLCRWLFNANEFVFVD